jgi:hypothetical protein
MSPRRGTALASVAALLVLIPVAGCGRDDFENKPKPAVPLEATIQISADKIDVSPDTFGAGIVTFVIANNSEQNAALTIKGPVTATSSPIPSNANGVFKIEMKSGDYQLSVDGNEDILPAQVDVGAPRESSNNELLQP